MLKKEAKAKLKVVKSQLNYYKSDLKINGCIWDEKFKDFVLKRIDALTLEENSLLKELGYA